MSGAGDRSRGELLAGVAGLALLILAAAVSNRLGGPPRPLPAAAAADRFAAGRAMVDVEQLASRPRPLGSEAHRLAADYLLARMDELGLAPSVHEATVASDLGEDRIRAARVRNLVGRRAGIGNGGAGALLLVAHYDSRPNTPGAGDDAAGVAVVLETVRALGRRAPLARDLLVLLTDGEELGLLGARGFASEHPWIEEVAVVLNFEGRGSRGPVTMFETGRADVALVRLLGRTAPRPVASSLSAAVYERMPNDTDFTVFRGRGLSGLNFAFIGGVAVYHTALDTAARLDPASLQHAGDSAVALIRRLDGGEIAPGGEGGVWFNPLGGWLLVTSSQVGLAAALILAVLTLAVAVAGRRRGSLDAAELGRASLRTLAVLALAPLAGAALWKLFADSAPLLLDLPHRLPHRLGAVGAALALAGLAAAAVVCGLGGRPRPLATALGVALPWAVLAVAAAALLPAVGFLFWWPLWGLVGAAAAILLADPARPRAVLLLAAGAVPGVALLAPLAVLVFQAMTPRLALVALAPVGLVLALAQPVLRAVAAGRQRLALAALASALAVLALAVRGGPDAERPRAVDLLHLEELDQGAAFWLSRDERPHPWLRERLGQEPEEWQAPPGIGLPERAILKSVAVPASAPGPQADEVEDLRVDGRRLTVRLRSPEGAPMLRVAALSAVQIESVELAGKLFERSGEAATEPLVLELAGLPPEGLEVSFQLPDRWPLELHLTEQFYGLPAAADMPPELIPRSRWTSHSRFVHRSFLR